MRGNASNSAFYAHDYEGSGENDLRDHEESVDALSTLLHKLSSGRDIEGPEGQLQLWRHHYDHVRLANPCTKCNFLARGVLQGSFPSLATTMRGICSRFEKEKILNLVG